MASRCFRVTVKGTGGEFVLAEADSFFTELYAPLCTDGYLNIEDLHTEASDITAHKNIVSLYGGFDTCVLEIEEITLPSDKLPSLGYMTYTGHCIVNDIPLQVSYETRPVATIPLKSVLMYETGIHTTEPGEGCYDPTLETFVEEQGTFGSAFVTTEGQEIDPDLFLGICTETTFGNMLVKLKYDETTLLLASLEENTPTKNMVINVGYINPEYIDYLN